MAIFRIFEWHVKAGMEEEHERAFDWHLRHWLEKHPRVLSARYFRPTEGQGVPMNRRLCLVECESLEALQLVKTVEKDPECDAVLAACVRCIEEGALPFTIWEDASRQLWKET